MAAPVEKVAAVLKDVASWADWNRTIERIDRPASGPLTPGEAVTVKQFRLPAATWTVSAVDDGGFAWTATSGGVRNTGEHFAVDAGRGRTRVTLLRMEGVMARVVTLFYAGLIRRYVAAEGAGLRERVEAG